MGLWYRAPIVITAITNAPTVVLQGTNSAAVPVRLHRIELQSNQTGSTQTVIPLQLGTYTSGTAGGSTPVATPVIRRNTVTATTIFKAITATMGTTFTSLGEEYQWNGATPFDIVLGKDGSVLELGVSVVWALIIPSASGTPSLSGKVTFEEM